MSLIPNVPYGDYIIRPIGDQHAKALACTNEECKKVYQRIDLMLGTCVDGIRIKAQCPGCGARRIYLELQGAACQELIPLRPAHSDPSLQLTDRDF